MTPYEASVAELIDGFKLHEMGQRYLASESSIRAVIKGNQGGGTAWTTFDAVIRLLGIHPVKRRNVLNKPIRFVSKCLPKNDDDEENQQYVEFKRRFPPELIRKDITARSSTMIVRDPNGGSDRKVEFLSKKQDIDAFMSVQRSAYYQDEEIERTKWDENQMRLLAEGGDTTITLTPVRGLDWTYDNIWLRAKKIWRSDTICKVFGFPKVEHQDKGSEIEVFCWATDDNPVMESSSVDRIFSDIDDKDELAMRRYGVFRQVSGRIYKSFDKSVHVVSSDKVFDPNMFRNYWHFRMIDYHPQKPWNVTWVAVTPTHEWFVWNELEAHHDNCVTIDLRERIKAESLLDEDDPYNRATYIDPLAKVKQPNTGSSVFEDLTRGYDGLRRCTAADTKTTTERDGQTSGRMNIKHRLKNSLICGVPGNNLRRGITDIRYGDYLPTIWFMDNCKGHIEHFNSWRYIDHQMEHTRATKVVKRESEKWSDYCKNIEFLGVHSPVWYEVRNRPYEPSRIFQGQRR